MSAGAAARGSGQDFRHDALLYAGDEEFVAGTVPFILTGIEAGEPVLVVVDKHKIGLLESELGADAAHVQFADMREVGSNPARLIPAWKHFLDARKQPRTRVWGIGEPIWSGRSEAELVECHRHEALLNLAFAEAAPLSLLCPYDTAALDPEVIAGARCSHPTVVDDGARHASVCLLRPRFARGRRSRSRCPSRARRCTSSSSSRTISPTSAASSRGAHAPPGLEHERGEDVVLAVNEVATNSVRHGGGGGTLRAWQEPDALICEVRDRGRLEDPLVGRRRPSGAQVGGYGLWLANQVCDLVQLRSHEHGSTVRVHMRTS